MSIRPDRWIREMCRKHRMIEPFEENQVREGVISYGISSYGYDLRIADRCENVTEDPYPPTRCASSACFSPELSSRLPLSWDTCGVACGSRWDSHPCTPAPSNGRDRVHWFDWPGTGAFRAELRSASGPLAIHLYDASLSACLASDDATVALPSLPSGRYALVVDGPSGTEDSYAVVVASE